MKLPIDYSKTTTGLTVKQQFILSSMMIVLFVHLGLMFRLQVLGFQNTTNEGLSNLSIEAK